MKDDLIQQTMRRKKVDAVEVELTNKSNSLIKKSLKEKKEKQNEPALTDRNIYFSQDQISFDQIG